MTTPTQTLKVIKKKSINEKRRNSFADIKTSRSKNSIEIDIENI